MTESWATSDYAGLFRRFGVTPNRAHDPDISIVAGQPANRPLWGPDSAMDVGGAGWTLEDAQLATVGEAIERWQTHPLPQDRSVRAAFSRWSLADEAVDPATIVLFHRDQYALDAFPFEALSRDTECDWTPFRQATSGRRVWLPSELAWLDLRPAGAGGMRPRFTPMISTGLSCAATPQTAVLRGLQEVIERDALLGAWWRSYDVAELASDAAFALLGEETAHRLRRPNLTYRFYAIETPFAANVAVVTVAGEDSEGFCFSLGAACRETWPAALAKASLEAVQGRHYVRYLKGSSGSPPPREPRSFAEHAAHYSHFPQDLTRTALHAPPQLTGAKDDIDSIASYAHQLGATRRVLFRLMTPPAIAARHPGWCVVRVVVPGLQPIHSSHRYPFLGGPLWDRPVSDWEAVPPHPMA